MSFMSCELLLVRRILTKKSTTGELSVDGARECYILEDVYRRPGDPKVPGATAIPCGRYKVVKTYSPRFKRLMYLLENVPGFQGIRIHAGNDKDDTEGCLLPGRTLALDRVGESVKALTALEAKLDAATLAGKEIFINVELGK